MSQRSLKVIGTDTYQSTTYDFLLTFRSNFRPISHCFRDKQRFPPRIANFPSRVFIAPDEGVTLGIGYWRKGQKKTRMMGLLDGRKRFKIGLAIMIQYQHVTDGWTDGQTRCHSKDRAFVYVMRIKM